MPARSSAARREQAATLRIVQGGAGVETGAVSLDAILSRADTLVEQPEEMVRLMALTSDPSGAALQLEEIVLGDQELASQVLALANSSYFSLPRPALYAREALVYLGFKMMRSLAMAANAHQLFSAAPRQLWRERKNLWRHSLDVALTSRRIAELLYAGGHADIGAEETFIAGLLHDIGKPTLDVWDPDRALLASRLMQERGLRYSEIEATVFPRGHCEVGAALASRWMLPPAIIEAIACHHCPATATSAPELAAIVALANELARSPKQPEPAGKSVPAGFYLPLVETALAQLGLTADEMPELAEACRAETESVRALHDLL